MIPEKRLARIAGVLYLAVAIFGGFAELVVRDGIVETGNAAATAESIRGSATLFRWGFASDLVQATIFLFTAMSLYLLLRHVNELVARAMVVIVAVAVAIICLNLLNQYVALQVATGEAASGSAGTDALAGLFADMHVAGYLIAQIFFGLWLLPLGYLVYRSGYFPKVLGVLLAVGCVGYLVDTFAHFLVPELAGSIEPIVVAPAAVGEIGFVIYLLVKGVRLPSRPALVPAAA
jgi:preprotein translocase subunit Sss1